MSRLLPSWLAEPVPRDHHETDEAFARRKRVSITVAGAGAGLLGVSLSSRPGSPRFYLASLALAGLYAGGAHASGPLHLGYEQTAEGRLRRPVLRPVLLGLAAFTAFYAVALIARRIPLLDRALRSVLLYADEGHAPLVYFTTLANGAGEEMFYRGAVFAALGSTHPVAKSSAIYALGTVPTRNPALVLAAGVMGVLFGVQRRATGGILAPLLTHLTWSTLMAHFLPPLFTPRATAADRPGT